MSAEIRNQVERPQVQRGENCDCCCSDPGGRNG